MSPSLFIIISFSLFKISGYNFSNLNYISDNDNYNHSIAVNDADSLKNIDSEAPILLIGNEK